ncbi:cell division protein FtsL [Sporolactobacillus shoreae]|uniref:Cell division protein FtsL n=1 Tax=Sporolactobacillus shoreae TaxID=1465501 RepID=A0A4Z0GUF4_9BACL|nr:cell division protein FtsL [Sporolactobacillus shoreae]TGB00197.1 cell division protein FtsL [Sporolactobacillus shoreae]
MSQTQRAFNLNESQYAEPRRQYVQGPSVNTRRITKGEKLLWVLAGTAVFLFAALMVTNQARLYMTSRDIQVLQDKLSNQSKVTQQLKADSDSLSSPDRIVKFAETKLGLKLDINNVKVLP